MAKKRIETGTRAYNEKIAQELESRGVRCYSFPSCISVPMGSGCELVFKGRRVDDEGNYDKDGVFKSNVVVLTYGEYPVNSGLRKKQRMIISIDYNYSVEQIVDRVMEDLIDRCFSEWYVEYAKKWYNFLSEESKEELKRWINIDLS